MRRLGSESNLDVAAAKDAMLSAESVQLSSASMLDIGAESMHLTSNEISVKSASGLDAAAESLQLDVSEGIDVWSGGDVKGSFGAATANLRGDALLTAAGDLSVSGEGSTGSLSGKLDATAEDARLRTLGGALVLVGYDEIKAMLA